MIDHNRCPVPGCPNRQGRYNAVRGLWECWACGAVLVRMTARFLQLAPGLRQLDKHHGNLPTYGPPDRVRLHGRSIRPDHGVEVAAIGGPARMVRIVYASEFYIYCPLAGCGAGQHVDRTIRTRA
jgi:hypothetical protein